MLFDLLSDYQIIDLCMSLILDHRYQAVLALSCTCQRFSRICRPLLRIEYTRLLEEPPTHMDGPVHSWYDSTGLLHRDGDLPAVTGGSCTASYCGQTIRLTLHEWFQHGQHHRDHDRPAVIFYDDDMQPVCQAWYAHGKEWREESHKSLLEIRKGVHLHRDGHHSSWYSLIYRMTPFRVSKWTTSS